jgi:predicted permease
VLTRNEIRQAVRRCIRKPVLSLPVSLVLAVSLGAVGASTALVHTVLLNELPFPAGDRLVSAYETLGERLRNVSYRSYARWRERQTSFEELAAMDLLTDFLLEEGERPERVNGILVTCTYFEVLGVRPLRGRGLLAEDCNPDAPNVAVLSQALWQRRFGGDPSIVGRTIRISGKSYEVAGVMPDLPQLEILGWSEMWAPLRIDARSPWRDPRTRRWSVVARLKAGATPESAEKELAALQAQLAEEFPDSHADCGARVRAAKETVAGTSRNGLLLLWGAVACVFLMSTVGIASILLADGARREREFGVRVALGASRSQIARQLFAECSVLAVLGGLAAVPLAAWTLAALRSSGGVPLPRLAELHWWNGPFLATLSAGVGLTAVVGALPVWLSAKADPRSCLQGTNRTTSGPGKQRSLAILVTAEIALATMLVHGFGLMLMSLKKLEQTPAGFETENLVFLEITLPAARYNSFERKAAFLQQSLRAIEESPAVAHAGVTASVLPLGGPQPAWTVFAEGHPLPEPGKEEISHIKNVSSGYFRAMGIPILRGRAFRPEEDWDLRRVVVVNQALARRFWPNQDAVGKRIKPNPNAEWEEIVGVARDVRQTSLREDPRPEVYRPYSQFKEYPAMGGHVTFVVRAKESPQAVVRVIESLLHSLDPALPKPEVQLGRQLVEDGKLRELLLTRLLAALGGLGLLIAILGIAGVTALMVAERRREIGVRMALGASPGAVAAQVLRFAGTLVAGGLAGGLAAGFAAARTLEGVFYGVSPSHPGMLALTVAALLAAAVLACLGPAISAVRTEPAEALRTE